MHVEQFGAGVFVIHDFLTAEECQAHITESERLGYEEAAIATPDGDRLYKEARNNDRIMYDNPALASALFARAAPLLPAICDGWHLSGFNQRWRFYRYEGEQFFKLHKDGTVRLSDTEESLLTFMIYLNDDFSGGETSFVWETLKSSPS